MISCCPLSSQSYFYGHLCYSISRLSDEAERHHRAKQWRWLLCKGDEKDWRERRGCEIGKRVREQKKTKWRSSSSSNGNFSLLCLFSFSSNSWCCCCRTTLSSSTFTILIQWWKRKDGCSSIKVANWWKSSHSPVWAVCAITASAHYQWSVIFSAFLQLYNFTSFNFEPENLK